MIKIRSRKVEERQWEKKTKRQKSWANKHHIVNQRLNNTNPPDPNFLDQILACMSSILIILN
jgi:hypothetical protein